jgi:transcriptional regulator with XRE-family HTH domain
MTASTGEHMTAGTDNGPELEIPIDTFAMRLMMVRAHRGLTVKEAAEKTGLGYGAWSNWERGSRPRDILDAVEAISSGLGIDPVWLLNGGALPQPGARRIRWGIDKHERREGGDSPFRQASTNLPDRPMDNRPKGRPTNGHLLGGRPTVLRSPTAE